MMPLERQYRFLLRAYPRSYRQHRGDEIVGTLLDSARPGQRRISWRDATDLLGGAVRERLGLHAVPGFLAGLHLAGPIALVLSAGMAAANWFVWTRNVPGPLIAAAWGLAVLVRVVFPGTGAVPAALAWLVTAVAMAVTAPLELLTGVWFVVAYGIPLVSGLIAVAGTGHRAGAVERVGLVAGSAALAGSTALSSATASPPAPWSWVTFPGWPQQYWLVPLVVALAGAGLLALRRDSRGMWAALILLVPVPEYMAPPYLPWRPAVEVPAWLAGPPGPHLLMLVMVLAVAVRLRGTGVLVAPGTVTGGAVAGSTVAGSTVAGGAVTGSAVTGSAVTGSAVTGSRLARCGALAAGLAAGLSGFAAVTGQPPGQPALTAMTLFAVAALLAVAAVTWRWLPPWAGRTLVGAALLATVVHGFAGQPPARPGQFVLALVLLELVALVTAGPGPSPEAGRRPGAVGAMLLGAGLTAYATYGLNRAGGSLYLSGSSPFADSGCPGAIDDPTVTVFCVQVPWAAMGAPLVATVALVPTLICAAAVVLDRGQHRPGPAVVAFAAGLLWCLLVLGPTREPLYQAAMVGAAVALLLAVRTRRTRLGRGRYEVNAAA